MSFSLGRRRISRGDAVEVCLAWVMGWVGSRTAFRGVHEEPGYDRPDVALATERGKTDGLGEGRIDGGGIDLQKGMPAGHSRQAIIPAQSEEDFFYLALVSTTTRT
jgi:hypothetical protein